MSKLTNPIAGSGKQGGEANAAQTVEDIRADLEHALEQDCFIYISYKQINGQAAIHLGGKRVPPAEVLDQILTAVKDNIVTEKRRLESEAGKKYDLAN